MAHTSSSNHFPLPSALATPLCCHLPQGKGRGVVATKDIELGDLIACVSPAAVLHGPVDETPDVSLLMPQLLQMRPETLPWSVRAALQHLSDGSGKGLLDRG